MASFMACTQSLWPEQGHCGEKSRSALSMELGTSR
jgi:hypothetical protein